MMLKKLIFFTLIIIDIISLITIIYLVSILNINIVIQLTIFIGFLNIILCSYICISKYYENREIYEVNPDKLKKIILNCYCKYVTKKENDTLYHELSQLSGLYSYVKNKKNIKPYIIINK